MCISSPYANSPWHSSHTSGHLTSLVSPCHSVKLSKQRTCSLHDLDPWPGMPSPHPHCISPSRTPASQNHASREAQLRPSCGFLILCLLLFSVMFQVSPCREFWKSFHTALSCLFISFLNYQSPPLATPFYLIISMTFTPSFSLLHSYLTPGWSLSLLSPRCVSQPCLKTAVAFPVCAWSSPLDPALILLPSLHIFTAWQEPLCFQLSFLRPWSLLPYLFPCRQEVSEMEPPI